MIFTYGNLSPNGILLGGHSVVAYKTIEIGARKVIYIYDNNSAGGPGN